MKHISNTSKDIYSLIRKNVKNYWIDDEIDSWVVVDDKELD